MTEQATQTESQKVRRLYLSVSPSFSIRSANRQEIKIARKIESVAGLIQFKDKPITIEKGGHIPNNCYLDTGYGDIYRVFRENNLLHLQAISTGKGACSPEVIKDCGLYSVGGEGVIKIRDWGSNLPDELEKTG